MSTSLIYEPLNSDKNEIRLLDLLPAKDGGKDDVICVLRTASLDSHEPYEALSYTWGKNLSPLPISIKYGSIHTRLVIQENLYQALLHLRGNVVTLWADAICINQADNAEKSQQVQKMARIYREAQRVRVWLGVAENNSDRAANSLIGIFALWGTTFLPPFNLKDSLPTVLHIPAFNLEDSLSAVLQKIDTKTSETARIDLEAIDALLSRTWWSRIWVVQEVALAKEVLFHCGHRVVYDKCLAMSIHILRLLKVKLSANSSRTRFENSVVRWQPHRRSYFVRYQLESQDRVDRTMRALLELSCISNAGNDTHMKATDPRDLIYGLAGLCSDWDNLGIVIDYSKTCEHLYLEVAMAMLQDDITFLSLSMSTESAVSWVPDWSTQIEQPLQNRHSTPTFGRPEQTKTMPGLEEPQLTIGNYVYFSASRAESPKAKIEFKQNSLAKISMILSIIRLDKVLNTSQPWSRVRLLDINYENEMQYIKSVFNMAKGSPQKYQGADSLDEAVFRTIVTDRERLASDPTVLRCRARKQFWDPIRQIYRQWLTTRSLGDKRLLLDDIVRTMDSRYFDSLSEYSEARTPFKTAEGWIGLGPHSVRSEDVIVVILGADVPYIIRIGEDGKYRLVGEAYVHGVMDGEAMDMALPVEIIDLY